MTILKELFKYIRNKIEIFTQFLQTTTPDILAISELYRKLLLQPLVFYAITYSEYTKVVLVYHIIFYHVTIN
jgi:hypothetical protein